MAKEKISRRAVGADSERDVREALKSMGRNQGGVERNHWSSAGNSDND